MTPGRPFQPLTLGMVFEIGIRILRRHVGPLLLLAVVFQAPAGLLTSAAGLAFSDTLLDLLPGLSTGRQSVDLSLSPGDVQRLSGSLGLVVVATALAGVLGSVAALAYAAVVAADHDGRDMGAREASALALRRALVGLGVVIVSSLVVVALGLLAGGLMAVALVAMPPDPSGGGPGVFAAILVGVACALALVVLSVRWGVALPAVALEPGGPLRALTRSWRLTAGQAWRTAGVIVGAGLAALLLGAIVGQLLAFVLVDVVASRLSLGPIPDLFVGVVSSVVAAPVVPVLVAVLYHDLRARRDVPVGGSDVPSSRSPSNP
jgi:hypothetical protein